MIATPDAALAEARAALANEWKAKDPRTASEVLAFYRETPNLAADLDAWHEQPGRQSWTDMLVHVARQSGAQRVVDIGCGAGHDLAALRQANPGLHLVGIEPNETLRNAVFNTVGVDAACDSFDNASGYIEAADLLVCIDVLEHIPDPESFLGGIAQRAKIGAWLFETTGTDDCTTPLHLAANRGWHPGRVLERYGFELQDYAERVRVWQRTAEAGAPRAGLLLCAYRGVSAESLASIMALTSGHQTSWRIRTKVGDSWIGRSRSIVVTKWWAETNDDVFLIVDDDVAFQAADAERLVELCRGGLDIVCGAYPVHNGAHLSLRCLPGTEEITFGPGQPPVEIQYAATGFMAVHRRVIDTLVADLPLVSPRQPWAYYPLFPTPIVADEENGEPEMLSEDWGFCHLAQQHGFRIWLDPQTRLSHGSHVPVTVQNMAAIHAAIGKA